MSAPSKLNLQELSRLSSTQDVNIFKKNYLKKSQPVVLESYSHHWEAHKKWTLEYFKEKYGSFQVPIMEVDYSISGESYLGGDSPRMLFKDYLALIEKKKTQKKIFLFNLIQKAKELKKDYDFPPYIKHYLKKNPYLFFGGAGSFVPLHFDLDMSHIFLTQFQGRKRILLFPPDSEISYYRHPLTVTAHMDLRNPDFEAYPLLRGLQGYECILKEGETLYIPSGWWHFVDYVEGGFSLSLRAMDKSYFCRLKGLYRIFLLVVVDHYLSRLLGVKKYFSFKEKWAQKRARNYSKVKILELSS